MSADAAVLLGFLGDRLLRDHPIGPSTTYRVGGSAAWFVEVADEDELADIARALAGSDVDVLVVGRGSNLLVSDSGFDGLALALGESFAGVEVSGTTVVAGGSASLPVVARRTVAAGLTGFEWAVGVPGSIGGAVRMNAGGHGSDMAASLVRVRVVDLATGEDCWVDAAGLQLGYRSSSVTAHQVVTSAVLELAPGDVAEGEERITDIVRWRRENQPGGQNAGSVFTNPPGDSAGRLVDRAGCKGMRVGSAAVSTKHANFFQADAGGSADDVAELMALVAHRVHEVTGVELHPETRMVGFPPFEELVERIARTSSSGRGEPGAT